jgi:ATP-dependent DNA ligase
MNFNEVVGKLYPQRANGVKPDKIPWSDENYVFQVKYDGDRRLLYFTKDGVKNSSRSKAKGTGLPVDKTDNVPHIRDLDIPELEGMILDCEFVHVRGFKDGVRKIMGCLPEKAIQRQEEWGAIEVRLFDIICHNGRFLHDEPWCIRNSILNAYYNKYFRDIGFIHLVEECYGTPESLQKQLNDIILNGGEGMVAKHTESKYRLSTEKCMSPLKNAWIKVKKEFNGDFVIIGFDEPTMKYTGDHLDTHLYWMDTDGDKYFTTGADEAMKLQDKLGDPLTPITKLKYMNWIGAIKFGEYDNGELVERGSVSGLTEALRADISSNPDNYIGKVIELDAMERIPDTKALRQPVFKGFRDDKEPEECQYESQKG